MRDSGVSGIWQAWHLPWAPLWRGRKNCLEKIKIFMYSFMNLYFAPEPLFCAPWNLYFAPHLGPKQMYCIEGSTCDIVGPFRRPTKWVGAPMVIRRPGNCAPLDPPHYAPSPCIDKVQSCISTAPLPKALSQACYASTTKHYDKIVVLWHAIVRGSDIVTEQERSLAISARPRLHAIRKDKSVRIAAFQARRY